MTLSNDLILQIKNAQGQLDFLKYGNVDFIIQNGDIYKFLSNTVFLCYFP